MGVSTLHSPCVLAANQAAVGALFPHLFISQGILNQDRNLFMGFWAQHAAAALMGSYVLSTMLCDASCTLNVFLGVTFVPFILFMVKSKSNKLQLCVAVLYPKCCMLGFVGLLFPRVWIKEDPRPGSVCLCSPSENEIVSSD